ncbi:MAG: DUF3422 domain-containing protein [Myxococcota bacterium]
MTEVDESFATALAAEWHARPRLDLPPLFRAIHVVELGRGDRQKESRARFDEYCEAVGGGRPPAGARFHVVEDGDVIHRWEQHTECATHSLFLASDGLDPFTQSPLDRIEPEYGRTLQTRRFVAIQIEVVRPPAGDPTGYALARSLIQADELYGGSMSAGCATVWSAFDLDEGGMTRLLVVAEPGHDERISRLTQRLLDLESYRFLSMAGLPVARFVMSALSRFEPQMDEIMGSLADSASELDEAAALERITGLAAQVEHLAIGNAFRFAATQAYARIVERRCEEVDEQTVGDHQRYTRFLLRSLVPAVRTCASAELRTQRLAEQTARAAEILDTRVGVARQQQNQSILGSVARSAEHQVKLQQAVEGFSIFAISYYAIGLLDYLAKSLEKLGLPIEPELATGIAVPLAIGLVWWAVHRVQSHATRE